jgi:cytochrome b561
VRYTPTAQWLHWITALLMLATIPIAWHVHDMPHGAPGRMVYFTIHKSFGVTILVLAAARLIWRSRHPAPRLPANMPPWATAVAHANHWLLYFVLLAMPLSGYLHSVTGNHPVSYFGLFEFPQLPVNDDLSKALLRVHLLGQWLVYLLLGLHVLGALWHAAIRRDSVLNRMLPLRPGAP